jgi:S1-C subfamily serine protease
MDHAVEAVAQGVRRRVASSGGKMRRKRAAVLAYFGAGSAAPLGSEEIAAALAGAGVLVKPPLADAGPDDLLELRLDRQAAKRQDTVGNVVDGRFPAADVPPSLHFLPDLVDRIAPAVVHVVTAEVQGSGFALDPDGYIVTNAHVIGTATEASVKFKEGYFRDGELKGVDPTSDLAVLRVKDDELATLPLRPLKSVRVGESVLAIGSPVGLEWSVSAGIVSGTNRTMKRPDGGHIDYMIQTDAEINPGNSGGPLVTLDGYVIGVNASGLIGQEIGGLNFAIPSDTVQSVYDEIREHGEVRRAAIGVSVSSVAFFGKEANRWGQDGGAKVTKLVGGGPAARAGLQEGDIILSFDSELVDEPGDVFRLLGRERIDRDCVVSLLRGDRVIEATVVPEKRC